MPQMNAASVLTMFLRTKYVEVGQRKGYTIKARLPNAGKPAEKFDKRDYMLDIDGRKLRQADNDWRAK